MSQGENLRTLEEPVKRWRVQKKKKKKKKNKVPKKELVEKVQRKSDRRTRTRQVLGKPGSFWDKLGIVSTLQQKVCRKGRR